MPHLPSVLLATLLLVSRVSFAAAPCEIGAPGCCLGDADCDDAEVCNGVETCLLVAGTCLPGASAGDDVPCDDGDNCTQTDVCQGRECRGTDPVVCTARDQCHAAGTCDPGTGVCSEPPLADDTPCDDADACTQPDTCQSGVCTGANPVVCVAADQCHGVGTCDPGTGLCSEPPLPDATSCNDGNACTKADRCQSGACTGTNPVVCSAPDQCHLAGVCDRQTGLCSNPEATDGTGCNDGNACTQSDTCQSGACTGGTPIVCSAADQCHLAGTCNPQTGVCSNPEATDGTSCSDGNACTRSDACQNGTCLGANPVVCTARDQCHVVGICNPQTGICSNPEATDGTSCNDGNACTRSDTCQEGTCHGANPIICTAQDQCHVAGTCNPQTGACSNPEAADGTGCNDGNACTRTDTCQDGACHGANPVVCTAQNQCHLVGTCNPQTGVCSNPEATDGTGCTDGNACTRTDTCQDGTCRGGNAIVCTAQDQCHVAGTCNPQTGTCSNPDATDGTGCNDGNACTRADTCQDGRCQGANPIVCTAQGQCHVAGTCNPQTGTCSNPDATDGTGCNDGNACTRSDTCQDGSCRGANPVVCTAQDQCHVAGTCNPTTGTCSNPNATDGTGCSDGNACTRADACQLGTCRGANPVVCTAQDQCHVAGTCNTQTGTCSNPEATDGTGCNDANACTRTDTCQDGTCRGANAIVCTAQDQCHVAGTCNPTTGACSNPEATDGTGCNDANACTRTDICQDGRCQGGNPIVCTAQDQCHLAGTCNPTTGACSNPNATDGTGCTDGNACTRTDACQLGTCRGANPVVCTAQDQCHLAGTCNPTTGTCSNPNATDGTGCTDGNACTRTDACQLGTCRGANPIVCTAQDQCHLAGTCNPTTGVCSNPEATDGTGCTDGNACTRSDSCQDGTCRGANPVVCTAQDQCHLAGTCNLQTGTCSNPEATDGTGCNDANACTRTDACQDGRCQGGNPIVCTAQDQCHVAGTCNPTTGACSNPNATDGTGCTDGNACTRSDACQLGTCRGANPVVCTAQDQCHLAGTCNPQTGACSNPNAIDGTGCTDGNACTRTDACQLGTCRGANPVVCTAQDQCHLAGTCNPTTGACSNPEATDGTGCNDANACTRTDTCQDGTCRGGNAIVCTAQDQCHVVGTCNPTTGVCSNPNATDGTGCNDSNACTRTDACQLGTCRGANPVVCTAQDQCHLAGTCNPQTGACSNPNAIDGTGCTDGNACTRTDACQLGTCRGANPVVCTAQDQCHVAGTCNAQTGTCSNPSAPNSSDCDDGDACTRSDTCQLGSCRGADPIVCVPQDQCHLAGTCNTTTGVCSNPPANNGTGCNDSDACTRTDACQGGLCTGGNPVVCPLPDQCHTRGTCDPANGACSNPPLPNDTPCDDANACTQTDACQVGTCTGADPVICPTPDQCHDPGTCDPQSGACSNPPVIDGTPCNDTNACTRTDTCQTGACTGSNPVVCPPPDECHLPTTCDTQSGACPPIPKPDDTPCSDDAVQCTKDACASGVCAHEVLDRLCDETDKCILAHCQPGAANGGPDGCISEPVNEGETCTEDGFTCTEDLCTAGVCAHGAVQSHCTSTEFCLPMTCDPARAATETSGCVPVPERVNGAECSEDGDPCTADACGAGVCAHAAVTDKTTCDPVRPAYERAIALVGDAGRLSAQVAGALPPQAVQDAIQTAQSLAGSAASLTSEFELVARILAGKAEVPLAPLRTRTGRVPSSLETSAQRRGRMASAQLKEAPKAVQGFLRGLGPARREGLLNQVTAREFKQQGGALLRGTKLLRRELKRLQRVSGHFAR